MGYRKSEDMPGSYGLPFVGEVLELFSQQEKFHRERSKRYGLCFKTQLMGKKVAILIGPEANQLVLSKQPEKFSSKIGWSILEPFFGEGLMLLDGDRHLTTRKIMYPAFCKQAIHNYFHIIQNTVVDYLSKRWTSANPIILINKLRQLSLFVSCRLFLGVESDQEIEALSYHFLTVFQGVRTVIRWNIPSTKFGKALRSRQKLEFFIRSKILQRRSNLEDIQDVLGLLLIATDEFGNCLTDEEIITQILMLLYAGHETVAKLLCWTLVELSNYPAWVEKLRIELAQVVDSDLLDVTHLSHLSQMNYFLKEVERLYPPIYSIPRGVIADVEYEDYLIPEGWYIVLSPLLTHRLPELYSDPERFDPDRFAPPREEHKKHPFALIGFGGGVHKCIGQELALMEAKIILAVFIHNFNWTITPEYWAIAPILQPNKTEPLLRARFYKGELAKR